MKKIILVMAVLALLSLIGTAEAAQFMNITFDDDIIGSAPGTGSVGTPITTVKAIGGYDTDPLPTYDPGYKSPPTADCGTITVDNVAGMNKAAVMTTNSTNGELGALWMDTSFLVSSSQISSQISMKFDINVLAAPTQATTQPKFLNDTQDQAGILFGINNAHNGIWAFRFVVAPTSETGGVFAFRSANNTRLITFGNYVEGQKYNLTLSADYATGMVDAYINDVLAISSHHFWDSGKTTPTTSGEIFMHLNGESGYANQLAIDNIQAFNTTVPEPSSIIALLGGLGSLLAFRRRIA